MNIEKKLKLFFCLIILSLPGLSHYASVYFGPKNDIERKIYIIKSINREQFNALSPFHDIPLRPEAQKDIFNMIVEIPRNTQDKIEINKSEKYNPLMYDIKDNKIRKITYKAKNTNIEGYPFNYGALPQTWEHIAKKDPHTKLYGDNDPIDVFDISEIEASSGEVTKVKIIGAIAMIDTGETDWKLLGINIKDKLANKYNNIKDIPDNIMDSIYDFLLNYKTSEGKPQNEFYSKVFWDKAESLKIIEEVHKNWRELCNNPEKIMQAVKENRPDKLKELPICIH